MQQEFIFFEEAWNEKSKENRTGEVLDGRISSTREAADDSKRPRG